MKRRAKIQSRKPVAGWPFKAEWYPLSAVRHLLSIGEAKLEKLMRLDVFELKDFRNQGSSRPSWRVSRASIEQWLRGKPSVKYSAYLAAKAKPNFCNRRTEHSTDFRRKGRALHVRQPLPDHSTLAHSASRRKHSRRSDRPALQGKLN